MPWQTSDTVPFSRIGIVSSIPSESGVFGIFRGDYCILVGQSWNLKAHLLELISTVPVTDELSLRIELCPEAIAAERSALLQREVSDGASHGPSPATADRPPGMSFWHTNATFQDSGAPEA